MGNPRPSKVTINAILKNYLKSYETGMYVFNLGNVIFAKNILASIPMHRQSGVIWHNKNNLNGLIIYTDQVDIDDWLDLHQEQIITHWHNPTPYPFPRVRYNFAGNGTTGRLGGDKLDEYNRVYDLLTDDCYKAINDLNISRVQYAEMHGITIGMVDKMLKKCLTSKVY